MASQVSPRPERLRNWLQVHDITLAALGRELGVSETRVRGLIVSETMPTVLHARARALGIPAELLPRALDKKPGPKPKIPRFPGLTGTIISPRQEACPAGKEEHFA